MSNRYRVWCLSWDETEPDGRDVVGYDPAAEEKPSGCIAVVLWNLADPAEAATEYAEYVHDHRDGYEDAWPLKFRVRSPDGSTADFEVERDFSPTFSASAIKTEPTP